MKVYKKYKSGLFLTIDTTLPANGPLRFWKKSFKSFVKVILNDKLKIFHENVKPNQAQYNLDIEMAKISELSSKELDKYENITDEDLGYKPGVVGKVKLEYSPFGEALNHTKNKPNKRDKVVNIYKNLVFDTLHSFASLEISVIWKNCQLILCKKDWMIFIKKLMGSNMLLHRIKKTKI